MLTVACVLKTGGDYNKEYVDKLYEGVKSNLTIPFKFLCLTDDVNILSNDKHLPYSSEPLINDLQNIDNKYLKIKRYWSKIEAFRIKGKVLYFDLDTVIMSCLDGLVDGLFSVPGNNFHMLDSFKTKRDFASGIMAWNGDFGWLLDSFDIEACLLQYKKWDQSYIRDSARSKGTVINAIQDHIEGVYSYKNQCLTSKGRIRIPQDALIIYFHGTPRPHRVAWLEAGKTLYENLKERGD